jgi:hypothetical protein
MVSNDPYQDLAAALDEPEPEQFKFEKVGDDLLGQVIRWESRTVKSGERVPALVFGTKDGGLWWLLLSKDLVAKLVTDRDVQPGDLVGIRLARIGSNSFREFKVRCVPDRPRQPAPATQAEPWGYDDDGAPLPAAPLEDESPW